MDMANMQDAGSSSIAIARRDLLLEYKPGNGEDGWYVFFIDLHNGKLVIHYETSAQKGDEELDLAEFKTAENLYAKFRRPSTQLTDKECEKVMPLWPVLVAYPPPPHYIPDTRPCRYRYFDARIEEVSQSKHITMHGQEKCMCTFEITWLGGPNIWQRANVYCENIYLPGFGNIGEHPVLKQATKFFESREYIKPHGIDIGFTSSSSFQSTNVLHGETNVWKPNIEDHLVSSNNTKGSRIVIAEDENGFIVCRTQKEK